MHIHSLHWLMSTHQIFQSAFCQPCKFTTGEMAPMEGSSLAVGPDMAPTVIACLSRPCSGILALCGYLHICVIATLNSTVCVILLLYLSFCHHPPTSMPFSPTPLYTLAQY